MKHRKIARSNRHKKFKAIKSPEDDYNFNDSGVNLKNMNEQPIPRKWTQILETKNQIQMKSKQKKKKKTKDLIRVTTNLDPIEKGMTRSDKPLPSVIEQGLYESEYHFLNRLSKLSAKARAEANIEERFDVDLSQKVNTSEDITDNKDNDNNDSETEVKESNKKLKQKLKRIKKKQKKRSKKGRDDSFGHLSDPVMFGERVDEPPVLKPFKRKRLQNK